MTHRFLSPAAAEAFAGVTPEQVREDLARFDAGDWLGPRPVWVERIAADRWDDESTPGPARQIIINQALRFLADQAATVVDSEGRACRLQPVDDWQAIYVDGEIIPPAAEWRAGERLDVMVLVPVEEGE